MPNSVGDNQAKRKLAAGELVLCMGSTRYARRTAASM